MLVQKKSQNWKPMFYSCMNASCMLGELNKLLKRMIRLYMSKTRVFGFGTFLELAWHLQSTRSRRLVNGFWWFLVQNEAESLLVLFLLFPAHFCWVENNKHFQRSQKWCFFLAQLPTFACSGYLRQGYPTCKWPITGIEISHICEIDDLEVCCLPFK